ncbi:unnamed protein product [Rodentolepis nana]|uniref:Glyoxylate reductase/hydroxypyruvate reductase n=1 Tax=Rodentolepis nana TaxID=102285 RepID=A0A0R3T6C4_RODNA|nr:unnamed protein product [Rodentolepis nana]
MGTLGALTIADLREIKVAEPSDDHDRTTQSLLQALSTCISLIITNYTDWLSEVKNLLEEDAIKIMDFFSRQSIDFFSKLPEELQFVMSGDMDTKASDAISSSSNNVSALVLLVEGIGVAAGVVSCWRLPEKILQRLTKFGLKYECWSGPGIPPSQHLIERLKGVKGLICHPGVKIDSEVLNAAGSSLKVVSTMSVGYDHLDLKEMKSRNVRVGYVPDVLTDATAELTVGLLLAVSRRMGEASETVRAGKWGAWQPFWMCGKELKNSTVGIFGLGRIGRAVATRLAAFSPSRIIYASSGKRPGGYQSVTLFTKPDGTSVVAEPVSFDDLLKQSDFLCVCASMCEGLKSAFNEETFGKMKAGAVFVNIARGAMVDQEALFRALTKDIEAGGLWGAGLDVTTPEPLPADSPLLKLPNCFILPHIASATEETRWLMAERAVDNLVAALADEPMPSELKV